MSYFRSNDLEEGMVQRFIVDLDSGEIALVVGAQGAGGVTELHSVTFSGVTDFERARPSDRHSGSLDLDETDKGQTIYGIDDVGAGRRFRFTACLSSYGSVVFDYTEQVGGMVELPPTAGRP